MDVGSDQHNHPKYLNLLTDFSSKVHVRMKYRDTLCSHYTNYTQDTYPDSTFFMHSYYSSSSHMPWNQWQLKTHKKKLHPTWWVWSLFCNLQTSIQTNNYKSSNSDYSCSVNFSDRIVTLDLSLQHLWTSMEMNNHESSYSDYSCLVHFYNRIVNTGLQFATSKSNLELVGETSSFTL
jgi:hypothetical protein